MNSINSSRAPTPIKIYNRFSSSVGPGAAVVMDGLLIVDGPVDGSGT